MELRFLFSANCLVMVYICTELRKKIMQMNITMKHPTFFNTCSVPGRYKHSEIISNGNKLIEKGTASDQDLFIEIGCFIAS